MSAAVHTLGPWTVMPEEVDKAYIRIRGTKLGGRYKIANVITPIYDGADGSEAEETRANARLIAAAPELLAALQYLLADAECFAKHLRNSDCVAPARAAIAKATGEAA